MKIETTMRALADPTRLRIMRLLSAMELAVGELAQVLGQSQPRVSRHVAILCDAGLAERHREGSWVFLRAAVGNERGDPVGEAISRLLATAEREDAAFATMCTDDRRQLKNIRGAREDNAASYFARHAEEWDELRQLHSPDQLVEGNLLKALGDLPLGQLLDIGTGSGRMAELFAPQADHIVALDKSLDMLRVARAKLRAGYDAGNFLPYATAGVASMDVGGLNASDTGSFYGLGVDYMMTDSIRVGGEVLKHDFDDFNGTGLNFDATTASLRVAFQF